MKLRRLTSLLVVPAVAATACGADPSSDAQGEKLPTAAPLAQALQQTSESSAYRAELAMGMNMEMGGLGQAISFPADPATPMVFIESDADGEQHVVVDMSAMMNAMFESSGMEEDPSLTLGGDLSMETWLADSTMTVDLDGVSSMLQGTPGAAEMFPAEIVTVDLERLGEGLGGPEVASAITGQAAPDPVQMAVVLRDALGDADAVDGSDDRFAGQISFSEYSKAFGQDYETLLGGMDATFEEIGGPDGMSALLDVFDEIEVDVEVTLEGDAVDTIRFEMDLSPLWDALPDVAEASGEDLSDADMAEFDDMFADATFEMTMLMDYDLDPDVDVVIPEGDFPDVTDEFLDVYDDVFGDAD